MSGDYTRFTFNHKKNYSGVLKQQGRVSLDADWNEYIEMQDRKWRSETMDIIGPWDMGKGIVTEIAPDAFKIYPGPAGPEDLIGEFAIGNGRIYVDGIQVESHGRNIEKLEPRFAETNKLTGTYTYSFPQDGEKFDPRLAETKSTWPYTYSTQPFFPPELSGRDILDQKPPKLLRRTDLIYLDVWQREVTALEDPVIRETALGGPDTATRTQTIWQVKVLADVKKSGCSDRIEKWEKLIEPSGGRLTTRAVGTETEEDPCILPPQGGYRGLENRLYRVEVHAPGVSGQATFKWSRDNASITSLVTAIGPGGDRITVKTLGRDQILRFSRGDWIEILDDHIELGNMPGHLAKIKDIDEATHELFLELPLPDVTVFDPGDESRHTRVRRWDQKEEVLDSDGTIPITVGKEIMIEDGISISFSLPTEIDHFHQGDYWVFAARTADGTIEELKEAPPRGIHHHYCKLALVTWGRNIREMLVVDCREHWPWLDCGGCCTVTVGDGIDSHGQFRDIQDAIDSLGNRGGTVCIGRGVFVIKKPIRLDATKRNVTIRGMGSATIIALQASEQGATSVFQISGTQNVSIERLFAATVSDDIIKIEHSHSCAVRQCTLVNLKFEDPTTLNAQAGRAIYLTNGASQCSIEKNAIIAQQGIVQAKGHSAINNNSGLSINDNLFLVSLVSVLMEAAMNIDISRNQMRGLHIFDDLLKRFPRPEDSRDLYFEFELLISDIFAKTLFDQKQALGICVNIGTAVNVSDNIISACIGILSGSLTIGDFESNIISSMIGLALLSVVEDGIRFTNNYVTNFSTSDPYGKKSESDYLLAGILNTCFSSSSIHVEANQFKGINGIVMQSLNEMLAGFSVDDYLRFGPAIAREFERLKIADDGKKLMALILAPILKGQGLRDAMAVVISTLDDNKPQPLPGGVGSFGIAVSHRYERNDLGTIERGVFKSDAVVSADFSVIDNSFFICQHEAISLGFANVKEAPDLEEWSETGHLIQGNAMVVYGKGIVSEASHTRIQGNNIVCPEVAIEIDAPYSMIRDNFLRAEGTDTPSKWGEAAIIMVYNEADGLSISGNNLIGGPHAGILIREPVSNITIKDNHIEDMARGIWVNEDAFATNVCIESNKIHKCGNFPLLIREGTGMRIINNVFTDNLSTGYLIYITDVDGLEFRGNLIDGNDRSYGVYIGSSNYDDFALPISVQGNTIRNTRAGGTDDTAALYLNVPTKVLVENNFIGVNCVSRGDMAAFVRGKSINFLGNQCMRIGECSEEEKEEEKEEEPWLHPAVFVRPHLRGTITGNTIESSLRGGLEIRSGDDVIVSSNVIKTPGGAGRRSLEIYYVSRNLIVTSNITDGIQIGYAPNVIKEHNVT
jgi:hypothetical protein